MPAGCKESPAILDVHWTIWYCGLAGKNRMTAINQRKQKPIMKGISLHGKNIVNH